GAHNYLTSFPTRRSSDLKNKFDPKSGYMHEKEIIRIAQKAGFKLAAKSEINANPKDTTKHPNGVWSLPPSLRGGEKDKAKYQARSEEHTSELQSRENLVC